MPRPCIAAVLVSIATVLPSAAAQEASPSPSKTQVVLLGTGLPPPDPDRSGPSTAIVVNGTAYLIDAGPGVVRRAQAAMNKGAPALDPRKLRVVFFTHLHSDHTAGFPDLILTPWAMRRKHPLEVYGPRGIKAMSAHLLQAYRADIETRIEEDPVVSHRAVDAYRVNAHEIGKGVIYKDANITVTAFPVHHVMETYGYRFDTADRSIVISGDTSPVQQTIDMCHGCDILIHEVIPAAWLRTVPALSLSPPNITPPRRS